MVSKSAGVSDGGGGTETLLRVMADTAKPSQLPEGLTVEDIKRMYEGMVLIRAYDERQKKLQRSGRIGFCVTSTGEEAAQIGTAHALQPKDWVYPYYRQYGVLLYQGVSMDVMADHLFGNEHDLAKGRQMPAHYTHKDTHFVSFSSVIGTHLIHAVGTAMAAKYRKDPSAVVTYIGDGGTSSNDFHSAMTFAGVYKPPMVLFIVNNQYAISLPVSKQCGAESLASKGIGYGVPSIRVDGNDVIAVYQASKEAYTRARNGEGPTLVELFTYRAGPHSSSDDPTRYRGNEADQWLADEKDPIARAKKYMQSLGIWTEAYEEQVWEEARTRINLATTEAAQRPEPNWESLFEDVYAEVPPALARQRDELLEKEREFERQQEGEFPL
jgi:TPP-dependent pyruvate/acetoin dehydrogenase alpha subunit